MYEVVSKVEEGGGEGGKGRNILHKHKRCKILHELQVLLKIDKLDGQSNEVFFIACLHIYNFQ